MLVLAFDTCMDKMYVTLCRDGAALNSVAVPYEGMQTRCLARLAENVPPCPADTSHSARSRSPKLLETIKDILLENNLTFGDLDLIATSVGPGGFTAIRTCMTVARVMAQELGKKLIGVTSFEILSNLPIDYEGKKKLIALDARRESAYVAVEGEIKGIVPLTEINTDGYFVITDDKLQPILGGISYQSLDISLSEIIAKIAVEKSKNEDGDWGKLTPLYLSKPANS